MKLPAVYLLSFCLFTAGAQAAENPYDVLGKTLAPLVNLFVKESTNPARAMRAQMSLIEMTKLPPQFAGSTVDLAIEHPDKMRLHGPVLGEEITLCRNDQDIWAYPGAKIEAMIHQLGELPKRKKKFKLGELSLPFPEQQLVFLPILFQVRDGGGEELNGVNCRVLDVGLMPELAKSLRVEEWTARAWIGPDYKIVRLRVSRPDWKIVVAVDKMEFTTSLPEETWKPSPEESADVLKIDPPQFKQLLDALFGNAKRAAE